MRDEVGCVGLVVDAKPDAIEFYRPFGFVDIAFIEGRSTAFPRTTPMFVALSSVPPRR